MALRTTSKKSTVKRGRVRVRSFAGPPAPADDAAETAEITVGQRSLQTLRQHKGGLRKVLNTYADAIAKAEHLGQPLELVIKVDPRRAEPVVEQRAVEGDALDRALAAARQRGAVRVAEILKSPDMLSAREFAPLIGASHETINQKRKTGELLALEGTTRGLRYPRWQVTEDGRPLPGLAELARALPGGPWAVYRFLLQPHPGLKGKTGLEALQVNHVREVLEVAESIGQGSFR